MSWLNYHHLLYFWTVVREGGIAPAAAKLSLSPQTISGQVRLLEGALGEKLFDKRGRRLELTEVGRVVHGYAEDIFALGSELQDAVKGRRTGRQARLVVGIAEVVPKLIAKHLLEPLLSAGDGEGVHLVVHEDRADRLLIDLASHRLDACILDAPIPAGGGVRAFNHMLGECGVTFFSGAREAGAARRRFPACLDGAPMLLPTEEAAVRHALEAWFERVGVRPRVVAEFDDSALLEVFGAGLGYFPGPTPIRKEIEKAYGVHAVGEAEGVRERFYVVTLRRRLEHPAVRRLTEHARRELFIGAEG